LIVLSWIPPLRIIGLVLNDWRWKSILVGNAVPALYRAGKRCIVQARSAIPTMADQNGHFTCCADVCLYGLRPAVVPAAFLTRKMATSRERGNGQFERSGSESTPRAADVLRDGLSQVPALAVSVHGEIQAPNAEQRMHERILP
jgi:hypothetical protein